jgi:hypothetical protein
MYDELKSFKKVKRKLLILPVAMAACMVLFTIAAAAPSADLWPRWQAYSPGNTSIIDHTAWDILLKKYLITGHPSGVNRFRYADVTAGDRQALDTYLTELQKVRVSSLNRKEQQAYWINLYNSLTVKVILEHYPVKSIMDIDISPGFFSNGPWDAKLLHIEEEAVSLNDIEHRILRPVFRDNRVHYALNCASIGCPNLQPTAFTGGNIEELLETGAVEYINSSRGTQVINGRLQVSSIYTWFQADFGGSEAGVLSHLRKYARGSLADVLKTYSKGLRFTYDWNLNQP